MSRLIGDAFISILPEAAQFGPQAEAKIKQALAGIKPNVNIQANLSQASLQKAIAQVKAELAALTKGNNFVINGNTGPLEAKLAALEAQAAAVQSAMSKGGTGNLLSQADIAAATNDLGKMDGRLKQLTEDLADNGATGTAAFHAISAAIATAENQLSGVKFNGVINADDVQQVANLDKGLRTLEGTLRDTGNATGNTSGQARGLFAALSTIAHVSIPLFAKSMDDVSGSVIPGFGDVLMEALPHMLSYASGVHMMLESVVEFTAVWAPALIAVGAFMLAAAPEAYHVYEQLDAMNTVAKATGQTFGDFPKLTGALTASLKPQLLELYGIALQGVDSSSGKLGPALDVVAKGVDNVAARIVAWTQNSSGGLEKFITSGAQDAGLLADAFVQLGRTLGTILQSVPGYAKMLLEFGDACLTVLADVTRFIQPAIALFLKLHGAIFYLGLATTLVASFGTAMIKAAAATALGNTVEATSGKMAGLGSAIGSMMGNLVHSATATYAYVASLVALQGEEGAAAVTSKVFSDGLEAIPFGGIGLAVAAFSAVVGYGLFQAFTNSASAVQKFNAQMQNTIAQSNYLSLQQNIQAAIAATGAKLTDIDAEFNKLNQSTSSNSAANRTAAGQFGGVTTAVEKQAAAYGGLAQETTAYKAATSQLMSGLGKLQAESAITSIRQQDLATSYGGTSQAMELMSLAGVKASSLTTDSASQYAQLKIQLSGVAQGYGLMSTQAGAAGAQLDTINISTSAAAKALSTLTGAESAWLTMVTGGVTSLQTFESGITGLTKVSTTYTSATKTAAASTKTTAVSTAGLAKVTNTSTEATVAQQAAFAGQITAAGTLLGSLQGLSSASGNTAKSQGEVTTTMKAVVAQMLPFAKGSQTNTAMLSTLAQLVGGPATDSFQTLSKWVGNIAHPMDTAAYQTDKLTISSANLTSAAKNLATTLSQDITQAQTSAIMMNGLQAATNKFYTTMQSSNGTLTSAVKITGSDYYNALVKAGVGTQAATQYVDAFMKQQGFTQTAISQMNTYLDQQNTKLGTNATQAQAAKKALQGYAQGSPYNAKVVTTVNASGGVQVKGAGPGLNNVLAHLSFSDQANGGTYAAGGVVPGASSSVTSDTHLAAVKGGELIIPSQHAAKFGDMARRSGIPGFASGGTIGNMDTTAISNVNNTDQTGMQTGTQQVMAQAVKDMTTYVKQNATALGGTPVNYTPTAGVNQWRSIVLQALALNGEPASMLNQVLYQMMTESGGNPNAINLTDSNAAAGDPSRGLLQTIASTFAAYHVAGTSENIFNPLANVAAAINYAKHVYGPSLMRDGMGLGSGHGYSAGGIIPEKVMGVGVTSGTPYSFGSGEYAGPLMGNSASAGMTGNVGLLIPILQKQNVLLERANQIAAGTPQTYARSLNSAVGQGAQRAYFATGG